MTLMMEVVMFRLRVVDSRDYTLLFEEFYATEHEARQAAVIWFRQQADAAVADTIVGEDGDAYDQIVRYCEGPDRMEFNIAVV